MSRIKIEDAARRLGISRSKVYEHITAGKLIRVKDGARAFVTEDSMLALEAGDNPAPAPAEPETFEQRLERIAKLNGIASWDYAKLEPLREELEREDAIAASWNKP